jgi:hypothetical protein
MIPFHGLPLANIVRLKVGIDTLEPELMRVIDPVEEPNTIPEDVDPLRYTLEPVNVDPDELVKLGITVMVRYLTIETLPELSVLEYDRVYIPGMAVLTDPLATRVPDPSTLSIQVAPESE